MVPVTQNQHDTYRIIVLSRDGNDILTVPDGDRFGLPSVEIPCWQRVAENLTQAVRTDWGEEVLCLFEPNDLVGTSDAGIHYQAAEHWRTVGVPKMRTQWIPVATLSKEPLTGVSDHWAIEQSRVQCGADVKISPVGPFTGLGWFEELRGWIEGVIEPLGFKLNGNFRQLNASPTFSLIRFGTDGPALWFKAVGEPNQREFPITCVLSSLFPGHVPGMVAARPDWNGWLARETVGKLLSDVQEGALWKKAAAALADLQIGSIDHGAEILASGAHDLGVAALSKKVEPFLDTVTQLMEQQTKIPPAPLVRTELLLLRDRITAALEALDALGVPETLGHLDLNPGNIIASRDRCVFLDWAEAYIGNPFLTLQYMLEHLRRTMGVDSALERSLVNSYCERWQPMVGRTAIDDALSIAPLLAVFAYAAGNDVWLDEQRLLEPATAGYLRSLARRMHRELSVIGERRSLCVH